MVCSLIPQITFSAQLRQGGRDKEFFKLVLLMKKASHENAVLGVVIAKQQGQFKKSPLPACGCAAVCMLPNRITEITQVKS